MGLKNHWKICVIFIFSFFFSHLFNPVKSNAQCVLPLNSGHLYLTPTAGCTPHYVEIKNLYVNSTADTQFRIDWGDGTVEILTGDMDPVDGGPTDPIYTPDFSHTYTKSSTQCGFDITIEGTNACTLAEDARLELSVSIWDTDEVGLHIGPENIRVCQGSAAEVIFTDESDWNCYPRSIRQNNPPREIQWEYLGGTITGINIPGLGPAPVAGPFESVMNPGNQSLPISIPAEDPANPGNPLPVGAYFDVRMNNWNRCNPRLDGNDPVWRTARIEIVDTPDPDFVTRKENASNPVQTLFCVGDVIYFDNLTSKSPGANPRYTWEFFNDSTGTSSPVHTSNDKNPVFSFNDKGKKLIRLSVKDKNAIGNCERIIEKKIKISPSPQAAYITTDMSNQPVDPVFCINKDSSGTLSLRFVNVSSDTTDNTVWRWEFYDESGNLSASLPSSGYNDGSGSPTRQLDEMPGTYKTRLYAQDNMTGCGTYFEDSVSMVANPTADFTASDVCTGDLTKIFDQSSSDTTHGSNLIKWEWDFNYDGNSFSADSVILDPAVDSLYHQFTSEGSYQVGLRVTEGLNQCQGFIAKPVTTFPSPVIDFDMDVPKGCSPLAVNFNYLPESDTSQISEITWIMRYNTQVWDTIHLMTDTIKLSEPYSRTFINDSHDLLKIPVGLSVTSENGCTYLSSMDTVSVLPTMQTGFSAQNYDPLDKNCAPVQVEFRIDDVTISKSPDQYYWEIKDGDSLVYNVTKDGSVPTISYVFNNVTPAIKYYSVIVEAESNDVCFSDSTLRLSLNPVPESQFFMDTLNLDCEVMDTHVKAVQRGLYSYRWTIEKSGSSPYISTSLTDEFDYSYNRPASGQGNIPVMISLVTTNFAGCQSDTSSLSFEVPQQIPLYPYFTISPEEQTFPSTTVTITNQTEYGPYDYLWDFGDSLTTTDRDPLMHQYQEPGTYYITLTLIDGHCKNSYSISAIIFPRQPIIDFNYNPVSGCAPLTVSFENLSQYADPSRYNWDFGDQKGHSREENPTYTYRKAGIYSVMLTGSNNDSDSTSKYKKEIIEVYENPMVDFAIRPTLTYQDEPVYTSNHSVNADRYFWDFGDQSYSQIDEPIHKYSLPGVYDIILYAETAEGCKDSMQIQAAVEVLEGGRIKVPNAFSPDTSGPNGGSIDKSGTNDIFYPLTEGVSDYKMYIFNKWGEMLFFTDDLHTGWDGYFNGQLCPQDVYVFKLELEYTDGSSEIKVGDVNLLR